MPLRMRDVAKRIVRAAALVAVAPLLLSFAIRAKVLGKNRALEGSTQLLAAVPGTVGQYVRVAFLSRVLAQCASSATICYGTLLSKADAVIGSRTYVGPNCHLGLVDIGEDVMIGAGVHITSGKQTHGTDTLDRPFRDQPGVIGLVKIGRGSWIGSAAIVMADVGEQSIIGAGSVVTQPVPSRVLAAGVPARVIRSLAG
jgi:virginiamycin A acetyltransferase